MSSAPLDSAGAASESSENPDFTEDENRLRNLANARLRALLEDPTSEIPPGQLMSFVAKVGFKADPAATDQPAIKQQNILAILPGLPEERANEIVAQFKGAIAQYEQSRKELPSGGQ
jgi:hypothetical protein